MAAVICYIAAISSFHRFSTSFLTSLSLSGLSHQIYGHWHKFGIHTILIQYGHWIQFWNNWSTWHKQTKQYKDERWRRELLMFISIGAKQLIQQLLCCVHFKHLGWSLGETAWYTVISTWFSSPLYFFCLIHWFNVHWLVMILNIFVGKSI